MTESTTSGSTLVIELSGTFDFPAAERVARAVADASAGTLVVIDLGRVREFHDFGLVTLARALAGGHHRARVRGLGRHQLRMLAYLGVDGAELGLPA